MKLFSKFYEGVSNDKLEVYCFALKEGKNDKLIPYLEEKGFELTFIDADSLQAKKEGGYQEITQIRKKLEFESFKW